MSPMADRTRVLSVGAALCVVLAGCVERTAVTSVFDVVFDFLREDGVNLSVRPPTNSVTKRLRPKKNSIAIIVKEHPANPATSAAP
jgi:ABC-type uncharacterized transport system auxiliary subunit